MVGFFCLGHACSPGFSWKGPSMVSVVTNSETWHRPTVQLPSWQNPHDDLCIQRYVCCFPRKALPVILLDIVGDMIWIKEMTALRMTAGAFDAPGLDGDTMILDPFGYICEDLQQYSSISLIEWKQKGDGHRHQASLAGPSLFKLLISKSK